MPKPPRLVGPSRRGEKPLEPFAEASGFTLYRGDCVEVLSRLPTGAFDLIFADPPYFLSNGGTTCKGGRRVRVDKGEWDASSGIEEDFAFTLRWLKACKRVLKQSGTLWVSGTQHVIFQVGFALQKLDYKLLNTITWYKPNASPNLSCRYFTHSTELLLWASPQSRGKLQHTYNYQAMKAENGGKQMRDVWNLPRKGDEELSEDGQGRIWTLPTPGRTEKKLGGHPTQKPVSLLLRVIEASTEKGALVLDPFNGSGTTGVAATQLGRRYVGIEKDVQYLELSHRRLTAPG